MGGATDSRQPDGSVETEAHIVARIARTAALNCYGVTAVTGGRWYERLGARVGIGGHGISVHTTPELNVAVNLDLAAGVPREQVLANVREAISYAVQRDLGRSISQLTLNVNGL